VRVEIARAVTAAELARETAGFEARDESFDALRQRAFVERCGSPAAVDDYVVWRALREEGGALEDRTVYDTPDVFRALTPRRIELLEYLSSHDVPSIKELAAKLRRDYKNAYDDLVALRVWGLVDLLREGKNQRPVSRVTSLRVGWEK